MRTLEGKTIEGFMAAKRAVAIVSTIVSICAISSPVQGRTLDASVGITRTLERLFDLGFRAEVDYFHDISPQVSMGAWIACNRLRPKDDANEHTLIPARQTCGLTWLIEIAPAIRIADVPPGASRFRLFAQAGVGITIVRSDARVTDTSPRPYSIYAPAESSSIPVIDSQAAPSLSVGFAGRIHSGRLRSGFDLKFHALYLSPGELHYFSLAYEVAF